MTNKDNSYFVLHPSCCAGCRWWFFYCSLPASEGCDNRVTGLQLRTLAHTADEADECIAQYLREKEMRNTEIKQSI